MSGYIKVLDLARIVSFLWKRHLLHNTVHLQIVLWDKIIERKEDAKIQERAVTIEKFSDRPERDGPWTFPFEVSCLRLIFCVNQVPFMFHAP
jgi:hypothetical protein